MKIGAINVVCRNLERSLAFYRDVLGFKLIETEDFFAHLTCGERNVTLLGVAERDGADVPYCSVPTFSVDLYVDNIEKTAAELKARGVAFVKELKPGARSFFIKDPDGLVFEVIQPAAK